MCGLILEASVNLTVRFVSEMLELGIFLAAAAALAEGLVAMR